jgi:cell cycle checkpoint control protein RAD9A
MSLPLDLRFTDPAAPLFIDIEGDATESLFVISTSQVQGAPTASQTNNGNSGSNSNTKKREREQSSSQTPRIKKPMKVVQPAGLNARSSSTSRSESRVPGSMPPPSIIPGIKLSQMPRSQGHNHNDALLLSERKNEPLFLPSSQMSAADEELLRSTGLGIEAMDAQELADMLEGEGEEVDFSYMSQPPKDFKTVDKNALHDEMQVDGPESFELVEDAILDATQSDDMTRVSFLFNVHKPVLKYDVVVPTSI